MRKLNEVAERGMASDRLSVFTLYCAAEAGHSGVSFGDFRRSLKRAGYQVTRGERSYYVWGVRLRNGD